jgi:diaminopimelate decarboxylase
MDGPMHSFEFRNGTLCCEGVDLWQLAEREGTPLYVYSGGTVRDHFRRLSGAVEELDHLVCYAVKANSNLAVLDLLAREGAGFDIVSAGELYRVIKAGGDPRKCTFAGVGKTRPEIEYALEQGIYSFNVESEAELRYIDGIAANSGKMAPVALRVNPNVDAKTHKYISTGKSENKFGVDYDRVLEVYAKVAKKLSNIRLRGVQMHIGSQLTSVEPFVEAVEKVAPLAAELKEAHGIEFFSIGGGIGIVYENALASGRESWWTERKSDDGPAPINLEDYSKALVPHLEGLGLKILLEPGRFMVGNAGVLITRVLYEKRGIVKTFKIVDAGMNDLIRPALYQGHHDIVPLVEPQSATCEVVDVVGPICESGDFFAQNREIPVVKEGDYLALMSAGAYSFVMASNYNSRPFPAEILVEGDQAHVVRTRQTFDDLIAGEAIPG